MKDYHLDDASVQYYVMTGAGLHVSRVFVVHIDNQYVRHGKIEVDKLFHKEDITVTAKEKQAFIMKEIERQREMLKGEEPIIDMAPIVMNIIPVISSVIAGHISLSIRI